MSQAEPTARATDAVRTVVADLERRLPDLEAFYRDVHAHPELSGSEERTAGMVAGRLAAAGYAVTPGVGGHGVVGVLENGDGPVVGLRGDMDALPIREETGLSYASQVEASKPDGSTVGVMHACGHDVHTTCLVGAAEVLARGRDQWRGTAVIIAQPAEESVSGAAGMIADGLFRRFPRPDAVLGQHSSNAKAGSLWHRHGTLYAAAANLRVTIHGVGGHGARPEATVDPIVIGAHVVTRLQTIVSRELPPRTPAVVTVGSFHAGTRPNIVGPHAVLEITNRGPDDETVEQILEAVRRIVHAECQAGRSPREPDIEVTERTPEVTNDAALLDRILAAHQALFSDEVEELPFMVTGSEDFALYGRPEGPDDPLHPIPTAFWFLGTTAPEVWDAAPGVGLEKQLHIPGSHSPAYAPDPAPSLRRGVEALTAGAMTVLRIP